MRITMYDGAIFVPAHRNDPDPRKLDVDAVMLSVHHLKGRGIVVTAYMANGGMLNITSGQDALLEPASRLNRKKVNHWRQCVQHQIEVHCGRGWDLLRDFCHKHDLATDAG